jgi:hypothetical protein
MSVITENLSQDESLKISQLCALDWELENENTKYYTHTDTILFRQNIYLKFQTD